jgi:hypothetical protein
MSEYGRATPDLYMHACLKCVFVGPRPIRRAIIIYYRLYIIYIYIYIYIYILICRAMRPPSRRARTRTHARTHSLKAQF